MVVVQELRRIGLVPALPHDLGTTDLQHTGYESAGFFRYEEVYAPGE
jgi:hypothetical protein